MFEELTSWQCIKREAHDRLHSLVHSSGVTFVSHLGAFLLNSHAHSLHVFFCHVRGATNVRRDRCAIPIAVVIDHFLNGLDLLNGQ